LGDKSPFVMAAYVAALAAAGHPDEEEACEILAEAQGDVDADKGIRPFVGRRREPQRRG
jgi:hypothetical protein